MKKILSRIKFRIKNMNPNLKSVFICIIIAVIAVIIYIAYPIIFSSEEFDMKKDNDTGFYNSYEHGYIKQDIINDDFLSFNNGVLVTKNFLRTKIGIYDGSSSEKIPIPNNSQISDKNIVYLFNNVLYYKDTTTNTTVKIDDDCQSFVFDGNYIAYVKCNDVYIVTLNNINNYQVIENEWDVFFLQIRNEKLFIVSEKDNSYNFYVYDIKTIEKTAFSNFTFTYPINHLTICQDKYVFYYENTQRIYIVDLEKEMLNSLAQHKYLIDMTSNDTHIYFVAEKSESLLARITVEDENNGLWELDISGKAKIKISEECVFDDLLATNNYVYCYRKDYVLPRGMANSWVKGYEITQIPIN